MNGKVQIDSPMLLRSLTERRNIDACRTVMQDFVYPLFSVRYDDFTMDIVFHLKKLLRTLFLDLMNFIRL